MSLAKMILDQIILSTLRFFFGFLIVWVPIIGFAWAGNWFPVAIIYSVLFIPLAVLLHELGHAFAGVWLGYTLEKIVIGSGWVLCVKKFFGVPVELRILPFSGIVYPRTGPTQNVVARTLLFCAAGPLVNLVLGLGLVFANSIPLYLQAFCISNVMMFLSGFMPAAVCRVDTDLSIMIGAVYPNYVGIFRYGVGVDHLLFVRHFAERDFEKAQSYLSKCLAASPNEPSYLTNEAVLHFEMGGMDLCRESLQKVLALPNVPAGTRAYALTNLANIYGRMEDASLFASAESMLAEALQLMPEADYVREVLAWIQSKSRPESAPGGEVPVTSSCETELSPA